MVVTTKQIVHAALWLVVSLGAVAGCFLVMTAEFVAWMQVLIYLGAVVVLLLFGMMLTRAPIGPSEELTGANRVVALFAALAITAVLGVLIVDAFATTMIDVDGQESTASVMGEALFRYWVLPFEALSVLLLSALGRRHRALQVGRGGVSAPLTSVAPVSCALRYRCLRPAGAT